MSHTSIYGDRPYIFIRPELVKGNRAPYLHETVHIIALKTVTSKAPWLAEGFATYAATGVSKKYGGYVGDPFNPENKPIALLARRLANEEISKRVLPLIVVNGPLNDEEWKSYAFIYEDRKVAAPAFYYLSESFITYFVEKMGLKKMKRIFASPDLIGNIEKETGRSAAEWKAEWLKALTK